MKNARTFLTVLIAVFLSFTTYLPSGSATEQSVSLFIPGCGA